MKKFPIGTAYVDGSWSADNPFGSHDEDTVIVCTQEENEKDRLSKKFPMVIIEGDIMSDLLFYDLDIYPEVIEYCIVYCSEVSELDYLKNRHSTGDFIDTTHHYIEQILRWREYVESFSARAMKTLSYTLIQWHWERMHPGSFKTKLFYTKRGIYQYAQKLGNPILKEAILRKTDREYSMEEIEKCLETVGWDNQETLCDDSVIVFDREKFPHRIEREDGIPLFWENDDDIIEEISYGYLYPWRKEEGHQGWT